jgi:hypothetical protein
VYLTGSQCELEMVRHKLAFCLSPVILLILVHKWEPLLPQRSAKSEAKGSQVNGYKSCKKEMNSPEKI